MSQERKAGQLNDDWKFGAMTVAGVVSFFILVWLVFAATVSVGTGEIAVMTRFGRVTGQELGEGFHVKNPFDRANKYDVKVLKSEADADAASKDLQDVKAKLVLNYRIEAGKVSEMHKTVGHEYAPKLIDPAIQEVFKASTAKYGAAELIQQRAVVKENAIGLLRARLRKFGITVVDLSVTNFSFSEEFTNAIEQKQIAQQDAERAKFALEASKTEAEAQKAQGVTLTQQYLQKLFLDKWNGQLPEVWAGGGGDLLNLLVDATK